MSTVPTFHSAQLVEAYGPRLEDRVEVIEARTPAGEARVLIVADGVGGRSGGARAADLAMSWARDAVTVLPDVSDPGAWCEVFSLCDKAIEQDRAAGETTLVITVPTRTPAGHAVSGVSVGDSAAWIVGPTYHLDLTRGQARKPFLGSGAALPVPFQLAVDASKLLSGDWTLVVASDGLMKYTSPDKIRTALDDPDLGRAARRLLDAVRLPSGQLQDDVAIALCRASH